jgi:2-polyprenyl-6-methoxyphenol hydroxylase-like FAD-dependent oxidoreductase
LASASDATTAVIIGAGIGGLAAGLTLRRAGWNIRIHERAAIPRDLGFGLCLTPNALSALGELGVAEAVERSGATLKRLEVRRMNGRVLRRFDLHVRLRSVVTLRRDLHAALLAAVGHDVVRFGSEAAALSIDGRDFTVHFQDGSSDTGNVLIGADGVHSLIRRCLHPNESPPRPSDYCAIRGVAHDAVHYLGDLSGVGYLDDAIEAATMRASSEAVYWYLSLRSRDILDPEPLAILSERSAGFDAQFRNILSATRREDMRFDRLFERDALRTWGVGPVTLLGDAAHPVLPHTGQGAALALEDAVALGLSVSGSRDINRALRRYEAVRSRRTRTLIKLGPRIARVTTTRNVVIHAARSLAIRWTPEFLVAMFARAFQRDPHRELRSHPAV